MVVAKARALGLDQLVDAVSIGYVVLYLIVIALILWRAKGGPTKAIWAALVSVIFAVPIVLLAFESKQAATEVAAKNAEYLAKYEPAKAIFDKLCKEQSAPIIKRTVEDVEGVLLLKVRQKSDHNDWKNQMWSGAGLPGESAGESYIKDFLLDRQIPRVANTDQFGPWQVMQRVGEVGKRGFRFVVAPSLVAGGIDRYTAYVAKQELNMHPERVKLQATVFKEPSPQYAITFEDNIELALRQHWIAGTTVKVIDTKSNEVIGQQSFWNWDSGFGSTNQRSPWQVAVNRCPSYQSSLTNTHKFVDQVLIAQKGK